MRILVVEDDRLLNNTLCYNLNTAGYTVDSVLTKSAASGFLTKQDYDLIVLDINLPDGNGFDFCREVKERRPDTAIIFLTANDMESDMLKGYELGAEDYVTKPFPMSVFQKKLAVVLGRLTKQYGGDTYEDGTLTINFSEMSATLSGKPLTFTPLEYRLLKILMKNPQIVLTRQVLLEKLWDADGNFVDEHALTAAISRVRNKIETPDRQYIKTVYGMGYMDYRYRNVPPISPYIFQALLSKYHCNVPFLRHNFSFFSFSYYFYLKHKFLIYYTITIIFLQYISQIF